MTVYLAYKDTNTLMEGYYEQLMGVFDSEQKAWDYLRTTGDFEASELCKDGVSRVYHFDGEMSYHWSVHAADVNMPIYEPEKASTGDKADE